MLEDDAIFLQRTREHLLASVAELRHREWNVLHLGGHTWGRNLYPAAGCRHLAIPGPGFSGSHAVAYDRPFFRRLLDQLPGDAPGMRSWLESHRTIDRYLDAVERRFVCRPAVASQPSFLYQEDPEHWGDRIDEARRCRRQEEQRRRDGEAVAPVEGVYRLNPRWEVRVFEDRVVLYPPEDRQTRVLNDTAAIVLRLIDGRRSAAQIREVLRQVFPEAAADAARDVDRTLGGLIRCGAVEPRDAGRWEVG